MSDTCATCRCFKPEESQPQRGSCRRYPPPYPTTPAREWCGEWQAAHLPQIAMPQEPPFAGKAITAAVPLRFSDEDLMAAEGVAGPAERPDDVFVEPPKPKHAGGRPKGSGKKAVKP